jgi:hypothetical protein
MSCPYSIDAEFTWLIFLELPLLLSVCARVNLAGLLAGIARASLFFVSVRARLAEASTDRAGIRAP